MVSLPFFNAGAVEDFDMAYKEGIFYRIIGTNSVFHGRDLLEKEWYVQADITELFARVISRLHHGRSISPLLDNRKFIQILIDNTQAQAQAQLKSQNRELALVTRRASRSCFPGYTYLPPSGRSSEGELYIHSTIWSNYHAHVT